MSDRGNSAVRLAPLQVHPALLASALRLASAESRCCARIAEAASLAKKWGAEK